MIGLARTGPSGPWARPGPAITVRGVAVARGRPGGPTVSGCQCHPALEADADLPTGSHGPGGGGGGGPASALPPAEGPWALWLRT